MIPTILLIACFLCALLPAAMFIVNLWFFRAPLGRVSLADGHHVDVLIPARDEADNIEAVLRTVLASEKVTLGVWVYDDNSADATAAIVQSISAEDGRVRLLPSEALPQGWNGKQHACWKLAQASSAPLLLFLDADMRLASDAVARCVAQQQRSCVTLLSGFPRTVMVTPMEWLLLPLIQFVLLGLLPIFRMRQTTKPAYAAGCGQFMLAEREAYFASGGHAAIRATRHDGLRLPHLFREHGLRTDICDLTDHAYVRMYSSAAKVWSGLAKNATEGLGAPGRIVPVTVLLFLGQVLPATALVFFCYTLLSMHLLTGADIILSAHVKYVLAAFAVTTCLSFLPRLVASKTLQAANNICVAASRWCAHIGRAAMVCVAAAGHW